MTATEKLSESIQEMVAAKIKEAIEGAGVQPGVQLPGSGKVYFTERDRRVTPKSVMKLAERAAPAWARADFSAKRWMEAAEQACFREANPETALAFLLRKGVQVLANDWYTVAEREWQGYCGTNQSDAFAEWYPPLYPSTIAGRVPRGERFPEGKVFGEDSVMVNQKFGLIEAFDRELFDDDQTGQIKDRAARLGQGMATTENAYSALRFIGAAGTYQNLVVPVSNYTTLNFAQAVVSTPFSATLHSTNNGATTYGNRPTNFGAFGLTLLKQAWSDLIIANDPQGNRIIVKPDTLIVSGKDALHAELLVKPPAGVPYYPAVPGAGTTTASTAASGFPGGAFGANPFMALGLKIVVSRYLPDWAWSLGQKGRGFIFQERDPLEVIQEQAQSGQAFEMDAYRFRSRRRFEVDWVGGGSRFWWLGNDGTVAGAF